jgi:hypothetical protein
LEFLSKLLITHWHKQLLVVIGIDISNVSVSTHIYKTDESESKYLMSTNSHEVEDLSLSLVLV